jgi:hypothetical protein
MEINLVARCSSIWLRWETCRERLSILISKHGFLWEALRNHDPATASTKIRPGFNSYFQSFILFVMGCLKPPILWRWKRCRCLDFLYFWRTLCTVIKIHEEQLQVCNPKRAINPELSTRDWFTTSHALNNSATMINNFQGCVPVKNSW